MLMQRSTALFFFLALLVSFSLFKVKYKVVDIEQKLSQTLRQIQREEENIHILKAEWSYLNEPKRLKELAQKYLDVLPLKTDQIFAVSRFPQKAESREKGRPCSYLTAMDGRE